MFISHNLSRSLKDLGHHVDIVSGPPVLTGDNGIKIHHLPGLDLYDPDNLFRVPSLKELMDPINLIEWLGVSTMSFPEPYTFGQRAFKLLRRTAHRYDIIHDNQSLSYGIRNISRLGAHHCTPSIIPLPWIGTWQFGPPQLSGKN